MMDEERLLKAINVAKGGNRDIKDIFLRYNFHVYMEQFYCQDEHPWLSDETKWTPEKLEDSANWHTLIKNILSEDLRELGYDVYHKDFWDDSEIEPYKGIVFKKLLKDKVFEMTKNEYDLEKDLQSSDEIKELVKDEDFAKALYASLCNMDWSKEDIRVAFSWRYSGGIVARLREQNEDYMDFYCSGNEDIVDPKVEEALGKLGWKPQPYDDINY